MMKNMQEIRHYLDKISKSDSDYLMPKIVDQVYLCADSEKPGFSEFLDPMRLQNAKRRLAGLGKLGIMMEEYGGYTQAERKKLGFGFETLAAENFPISKIKLTYDVRYRTLTHPEFLGTIVGLGVDRAVIGDIVPLKDSWIIIIEPHLADFLHTNLQKVGKIPVTTEILPNDYEFFGLDNRVKETITCSSLKLVKILSATFNLSRQHTCDLIKSRKAFVNWNVEDRPSCLVKAGDMITLRSRGKIQITEILGKSRKDNFIIEIVRY